MLLALLPGRLQDSELAVQGRRGAVEPGCLRIDLQSKEGAELLKLVHVLLACWRHLVRPLRAEPGSKPQGKCEQRFLGVELVDTEFVFGTSRPSPRWRTAGLSLLQDVLTFGRSCTGAAAES